MSRLRVHETQKKLLRLINEKNIWGLTLREIGSLVGEPHPQKIKHHLSQLLKKSLLVRDDSEKKIESFEKIETSFFSIPILGSANCGEALRLAEVSPEGILKVSKSMVPKKDGLFALKAVGDSMNKAIIGKNGNNINDGDYVIVDSNQIVPRNNDYVLSIIDGLANIKKFIKDNDNKQIVLVSESSKEYPPIFISENDLSSYSVNGKVVQVIKMPKS